MILVSLANLIGKQQTEASANNSTSNIGSSTILVATVLLLLVGVMILSLLYIGVHYKKINFDFWLGLTLSFIIGLFGFFGFFCSKDKDERKNFILGCIISFAIKLVYNLIVLLAVLI